MTYTVLSEAVLPGTDVEGWLDSAFGYNKKVACFHSPGGNPFHL